MSGYNQRMVAISSRNVVTIDTHLGPMQLVHLPQGWTTSVNIFHHNIVFLLQHETDVAPNFIDDITVLGRQTRFELPNGDYKRHPNNPKVRKFVWLHLLDDHRILHRLGHAGATVSAKKLAGRFAVRELPVLGQTCNYNSRLPEDTSVTKITTWLPCRTVKHVRGFLEMAGTVRIWIRNFAAMSRPLVKLTMKSTPFTWQKEHQLAMDALKKAVITCPAIWPIDYKSGLDMILGVNSSEIACGFVLQQLNSKG